MAESLILNTSKKPLIPEGWVLEEHKDLGIVKYDSTKLSLYLSEKQKIEPLLGYELRKELYNKQNLNSVIFDWLLENPSYLPEEWKGKNIFFWGTLYRNSLGKLYVRFLYFFNGRWYGEHRQLNDLWSINDWAVIAIESLTADPLEIQNLTTSDAKIAELEKFKNKIEKTLRII